MRQDQIEKNAAYKVRGYRGVACRFAGWEERWEPYSCLVEDEDGNEYEEPTDEGEWVEDPNTGRCYVVMVGDDQKHLVSLDEMTVLDEDDYCHECGQIGCTHDGRDRE